MYAKTRKRKLSNVSGKWRMIHATRETIASPQISRIIMPSSMLEFLLLSFSLGSESWIYVNLQWNANNSSGETTLQTSNLGWEQTRTSVFGWKLD